MIDWDDLRYFLAVARRGTLARAGAELRINPTTVGRRLSTLEETAGARLFDRTPDGYHLTRAGHDLLVHAERMEAEALALERAISGADEKLSGVVRLSATEMIGTRFLAPHLARFHRDYPDIVLDLSCTTRAVNLGRREADIALRLARPTEENLVVKKLTAVALGLYASNQYLEARGVPSRPDESLSGHDVILFSDSRAFSVENAWLEERLGDATVVMRSDSVSSVFSAAAGGLGIALLPRVVAGAEPALRRIRTQDAPQARVIWQAVHRDLARAPRIRVVLDFLATIVQPEKKSAARGA